MMDFELKGIPEFERSVRELAKQFPLSAARGMYLGLELVMTDAKQNYVPVRLGILRTSGFVLIERKDGVIVGTIGFGGPAGSGNVGETNVKDVGYAIPQHENLDYHHTVGEAKYLERPFFAGIPMIGEEIVAAIQEDTGIS